MRLDRLDLLAFGHFTNRRLDFSAPARLHVVYGPNEAGKSTTLAAISDLLFGFKAKDHPYTFLHGKPLLGGRLRRADGTALEFVRQRTTRGAGLLSPDMRAALDDGVLSPFLLGMGREEFERLHCLNHARLRAGGDEMLRPDSDIGRKLFAAGAGLEDLRRLEAALSADIDRIGEHVGGGRGQKSQLLKAATLDYDAAERELKAASLKAGELARARDRLREAEESAAAAGEKMMILAQAQARLARVQRVRPLLAELDRLRRQAGGGPLFPDLPAGLAARWADILHRHELAAAAWRRSDQAMRDAAAELAALPAAGPFAKLAPAIAAISAQLGEYLKAGRDLPRCQAERRAKLETVAENLRALGLDMPAENAESQAPSAVDRAAARDLANRRRDLRQALAAAHESHAKAQTDAADAASALAALGQGGELDEAEALAAEADSLRDAPTRWEAAHSAATKAQADADRALSALVSLKLWQGDGAALDGLSLPSAAALADFENEINNLSLQEKALTTDIAKQETDLSDAAALLAAMRQAGEPPALAAVEAARQQRDAQIVALANGTATAQSALAAAAAADQLADRRLAEAARVQEFEATLKRQAIASARLARLNADQAALAQTRKDLAARWRNAWEPVTAGRPADMREWLAARAKALELRELADKAGLELAAATARRDRWTALWRAAAAALHQPGAPPTVMENEEPGALAARTQNLLQLLRRQGEQRRLLTLRHDETAKTLAAAARQVEKLQARRDELDAEWADAMTRLRQRSDLPDTALETVLDLWAAIETASKERRDRDHRIDGMNRDRTAFEARIDQIRNDLAAHMIDLPADDEAAAAALKTGLDDDTRLATVRAEKRRALEMLEKETAAAARRQEEAAAEMAEARAAHGLRDDDDPAALAAVADARRRLLQAGDELDEAALRADADAMSNDDALARLPVLAQETAQARAAHESALTQLGEAKSRWAQLQSEAGAEAAAARRNDAARRAGQAAQELLQAKAAQFLLRQAVKRYRDANQDPLLERASALFAAVAGAGAEGTGESNNDPIVGLDSRIGADNRPRLHALRRGGEAVAVEGLSEGTADQLFLALRLAALEQRAAAGRPLPFIADDIFMTSDDRRAEVILRLLAELGKSSQVIVFTHHRRIADAAVQAADGAAQIIELNADAPK